jgi:hypothetical protein
VQSAKPPQLADGPQLCDVATDSVGLRPPADQDSAFEIGLHRPTGQVRVAHQGNTVVHHDNLRVQRRSGQALAMRPVQAGGIESAERRFRWNVRDGLVRSPG